MKRILLILTLFFAGFLSVKAQDNEGNERLRDKMREYIQLRLKLNKDEADRFTPVFLRYFHEWKSTLRENRQDPLVMQQKIVELRLRYRPEFKEIVGEKRSNEVFRRQDDFVKEVKIIAAERMRDRQGPRRNRGVIE